MPDRIIKEKSRRSESLDALSDRAERLFWRLTTAVDDYGCFDADPRVLLATCFPLKVGSWTPSDMAEPLAELARSGSKGEPPTVCLYEAKGRVYGQIIAWFDHQRKRDSKPKFPFPTDQGVTLISPQPAASGGEWRLSAVGRRESGVERRESQ